MISIHEVVVHRRDEAVRGWRNWLSRPDLVPLAPFLQCEPHLTPDGSCVLSFPNRIDEEFRKAWLHYFLPFWAKGRPALTNSALRLMGGCRFYLSFISPVDWSDAC